MSVTTDIKWEAEQVEKLGKEIGYGNMMSLASALWRKMLKEKFKVNGTGAFVPCLMQDLKKGGKKMAEENAKLYDELVKDIL